MLRALRSRKPDIERAADGEANFWRQFNSGTFFAKRDPLAIPAFYRGLHHRAGLISTLPLVGEVDGKPVGVPIELLDQPDPAEDRQTTLSRMAASCVLRGEIVAVLGSFDEDGFARSVKVVDPAEAALEDDGTWTIATRRFSPAEILHVMPMALPGATRGTSTVELFRRTITGEIAASEYQANFYLDGGQPTTIIVNKDEEVPPEELEEMLQRYLAKVAGGRREPIVLPEKFEVKPLTLTNADSQFLESRQFAMVDIANIVGVPPYLIGAPGSSSVYSNDFEQRRALLDIYLRADLYAIERAFTRLLPEGLKAKFDPRSFLRLDPKGTAEVLHLTANLQTVNEQRAVLGLDPIPDGDRLASTALPGAAPAPTEAPSAV
ncbi:MAG: phage portal protein [Acidimicrobiales bacterium]|nr:phage portal protein [Acidimicrobiales bacterium]